jgi:hypothetical protein
VLGFLLGLFGHLFLARADKRLRDETQIMAALGTTVLGGIDVPDVHEEPAAPEPRSLRRKLVGLVVDDRPWHLPELPAAADETGLDIRYRRTLARLREHVPPGPGRVLVVVAKDDPAARRAAGRLAMIGRESRLSLHVVEVSAERPTVPDEAVPGVLVVVTAGTRTGWELVGIAEACGDAGHEVLGVVVTHRTRAADGAAPGDREEPAMAGAR